MELIGILIALVVANAWRRHFKRVREAKFRHALAGINLVAYENSRLRAVTVTDRSNVSN